MASDSGISEASGARQPGLTESTAAAGRRLGGDERGVSMLEFGLFLPILALIILGTMDMAKGLAVKFALEQATHRTIELASLSGRAKADYSYLATEARTAADVPAANVQISNWLECNNVRQPSYSGTCPSGQQSAKYVSVQIHKDYTPMFRSIPYVRRFAGADGTIRVTATSGVRVQ
jgi:Flp pilus assembly protein TadG